MSKVMVPPVVSVIMNCYNSAEYLAEAIDSVYAQSFPHWEIIFFDNASTDGSAKIAQGYDGRLRYFRNPQTVLLGCARNLAMAQAQGEYIAFLDCDDIWLPSKLEKQVGLFQSFPETGIVYSDAEFFLGKEKGYRLFVRNRPPHGRVFKDLLARYVMPMCTIIFRAELLKRYGNFDESFHVTEDADFFLRLAYYVPVLYVDEPLARRRIHSKSLTTTKKELFPQETEAMLAKFIQLWPSFEREFAPQISLRRVCIAYQYAVLDWERGDAASFRRRFGFYLGISKHIWISIPYLFSYFLYSWYKGFKHSIEYIQEHAK